MDSYAERVDELLTVYLSVEEHALVGCKIKGARRLLKTLGDFGVCIDSKNVSVNSLVLAVPYPLPTNGRDTKRLAVMRPT